MALPLLAPVFPRRMDPRDRLDLYVMLTQGNALRDVLQPGEEVTSFQIALTPEAAAAGLAISESAYAPRYADRVFFFQLTVAPQLRGSAIFNGPGFTGGVEITFATNLSAREKQYTVGIRVVNK